MVLFQQPALAYCVHTDQFFLSDCGCEEVIESKCPHCQTEQPAEPCDDCSDRIQIDVDDLVWFDLAIALPTFIPSPVIDGGVEVIHCHSTAEFGVTPIRPPPPPGGVSLMILHSVFRL